MIPVLKDNPIRKFTYVEMAFMHRWWEEADDDLKQETIQLVNSGQFQLNLGGWCMNDEASPTASAVIHQMTDGNQFILSNLGLKGRPTVAWHVDPFGHSYVTGGLWAQSGFDAFAVHRINYLDLQTRKDAQNLEFMWKGSSSLGPDGYIFFHILDSGYGSPKEMSFWNGNAWINTDPLLPSFEVNQVQIGESLVADARTRTAWYKHNQILIPFGSDFAHQNAYMSMLQMDKLIAYINSNSTYNATITYSSVADYVGAVNALNLTWSLEQPDFFTYVDNAHSWWSGYFTSRAYLKLFSRSRMNALRLGEQLYLFAKNMYLSADYVGGMYNISFLRAAIDVTQHHDAITGTEKDYVASSYWDQLYNGTQRVNRFVESVVGSFLKGPTGKTPTLLRRSNLMSQLTPNNVVVLVAYNSLAWNITEVLHIPTNRSDLVVYDEKKQVILSQINPVAKQEQNSRYPAKYNLFILARNMRPLSFATFFIGIANTTNPAVRGEVRNIKAGESFKVGSTGGYYTLLIDGTTQRLSKIINNRLGKTFKVQHQFSQYIPSGGIYNDGYSASGAYIFRPATDNRLRLDANGDGKSQNKKRTVAFRQKLGSRSSPGFILQPHVIDGELYSDTFNAIVCGVQLTHDPMTFDYQYYRTDGTTWGQMPLLDFLVFDSTDASYSPIVPNAQSGTFVVSKASASTAAQAITFKTAFTNTPVVMVSARGSTCDGSQFVTQVLSVTTSGAVIAIKRIDSDKGWNDLYLDYFAYDASEVSNTPLLRSGHAEVTLQLAANKKVLNATIPFDTNTDFVVNEPIILLSIQQTSPELKTGWIYPATTTFMSSNISFAVNFHPFIDDEVSANVTLRIEYLAFERIILFENVTAHDNQIENVAVSGPLLDEVQQTFKDGYAQSYRVFNIKDPDLQFVDNRVMIGPIDQGAEFITKYTTELSTNNEYFTNQASLEYVKRVYYPFWDERIAGNYYPSSGASYIEDTEDDVRFSTIVNQGHGVASLKDGELEMMLQRRCLQDDSKGVGEVLNTTFHTEPQVMIIMDDKETTANLNRRYYQMQQYKQSLFFGVTDSIDSYVSQYNTSWSAIHPSIPDGLPSNVFLTQLRYAYSGQKMGKNGGMVLQLQHMFETNESTTMSVDEKLSLSEILKWNVLQYKNSTEMNLLATIPLANMHRLPWNVEMEDKSEVVMIRDETRENKRRAMQKRADRDASVEIKPREIRTYVVNVDPDVPSHEMDRHDK
eukprot:52679_1